MQIKLENQFIQVTIYTRGAELTSLKHKAYDLEYLWQADPKFWSRHAPVLFPIVGKLKEDSYTYEGNTYHLTQHGFARDMDFSLIRQSEEYALFSLRSTDKTQDVYPFIFELEIAYTLHKNALEIGYKVVNRDVKDMHFSIGAHPGFNCPLLPDEEMEDYDLLFETEENTDTALLKNGLISDQKLPFLKNEKIVPLSMEIFKNDAIILEGMKSQKLSMRSRKSGRAVSVEFEGFPFLGIWSKPEGAPFICIEPWYGIADNTASTGEIKAKKGMMQLQPGQVFESSYRIVVE